MIVPAARAQQSLAADGAIACFLSSLLSFSLNADRAPQLKATVRRLSFSEADRKLMIISSLQRMKAAEFIRQDEANEVAKEASDLITSQLVDSAVASAIALTPVERKQWPISI